MEDAFDLDPRKQNDPWVPFDPLRCMVGGPCLADHDLSRSESVGVKMYYNTLSAHSVFRWR